MCDDYADIFWRDGVLWARAPATIAGRLEVRGLGILALSCLEAVPVVLVVDLVDRHSIERLPEANYWTVECDDKQARLPLLRLAPFELSAVAKLVMAQRNIGISAATET